MPKRYVTVTMSVPEEQTDLAMGVLASYPMLGVEVQTDELSVTFEQNDWQKDFEHDINAELEAMGIEGSINEITVEDDRNWNEEWEASIDPVIVNERIVIVPEWKAAEVDAPMKLLITPKMSFGTGHHATTRMMCRLMETRVQAGQSWIDVGTGTGVLAILAAKLGAKEVYAFDNDEWSIVNAKENVDRNNCADTVRLEQAALGDSPLPSCDGLAANLYRHLVIPNAQNFIDSVAPGGPIILSGILKYDADEVLGAFTSKGCVLEERLNETEWCALAITTPGNAQ